MNNISFFAGFGGFDLGFEKAGIKTVAQIENNEYCIRVLEKNYPDVLRFKDIRDVKGTNLPSTEIVSGGFPCQDASVAGKRKGFKGDKTSLWHEYYRLICEIKPRWVVAENVRGLLSVNSGRDFATILRDLSRGGYHVTWRVLRASDFGAPHQRERVFIVANRKRERIERFFEKEIPSLKEFSWVKGIRGVEDLRGRPDLPEPLIRRTNDGLSRRMDGLGNAVIPGQAEWIGQRIVELSA